MVLCSTCEAFDIQRLADGPRGYRYADIIAGNESSETPTRVQGCDFCRALVEYDPIVKLKRVGEIPEDAWFHFEVLSPAEPEGAGQSRRGMEAPIRANQLRVTLAPRYLVPLAQFQSNEFLAFDFYLVADPETPPATSEDVLGRFPGNDPLSAEHCTVVRQWLHECIQNRSHSRCNQTVSGNETNLDAWSVMLPSRYVEVLGKDHIRLAETKNQRGAYITLSHRWEGKKTGKCSTTTNNYDTRLHNIPITGLTKTFQDAISIAHRLDIKYLWIDSLCIIQDGDNGEDWSSESQNMAQYYQYSILTLTAVRSAGQAGVFPVTNQLDTRSLIQLPYRDRDGIKRGFIYLYSVKDNLPTSYTDLIRSDELLRRGWVFQEQLLSRRLLYYTEAGVIFECRTENPRNTLGDEWKQSSGAEIDDFGEMFRWTSKPPTDRDEPNRLVSSFRSGRFDLAEHSFDTWYKLVEEYSGKDLSYWSDRIRAISGITAEYQRFMQLRDIPPYVSGIWTQDIHFGLLWVQSGEPRSVAERVSGEEVKRKAIERVANIPSWSWASLPAHVSWKHLYPHRRKLLGTCKIISVADINEGETVQEWTLSPKTNKIRSPANLDVDNQIVPEISSARVLGLLKVQGKIRKIMIRAQRPSKDDKTFIFWDRFQHFSHDDFRRFAYSLLRPNLIAGLACFDNPIYGPSNIESGENGLALVYAFRIMTEKHAEHFGLSLGYWVPWNDLHYVLFLRRLGEKLYQRVGIGVVFGKDVEREFCEAVEEEFALV